MDDMLPRVMFAVFEVGTFYVHKFLADSDENFVYLSLWPLVVGIPAQFSLSYSGQRVGD